MNDARGTRILVVDDSEEIRGLLEIALGGVGYDVSLAEHGWAALARVKDDSPDLILLDVQMPGMDGFETLKRLKAIEGCSDIPVLFLTAETSMEGVVAGLGLGALDYIKKPINLRELLARVDRFVKLLHLLQPKHDRKKSQPARQSQVLSFRDRGRSAS